MSSPNTHFRFSNFVLLNRKLKKEKWQYIQNLDLNPTYVLEAQTYMSSFRSFETYYHPCMQVGNVFGHVCLVCLSVCVSVFLSVQAITFEPLDTKTSFLACRYILTISRSSLSIKVIGSRSRSYEKK